MKVIKSFESAGSRMSRRSQAEGGAGIGTGHPPGFGLNDVPVADLVDEKQPSHTDKQDISKKVISDVSQTGNSFIPILIDHECMAKYIMDHLLIELDEMYPKSFLIAGAEGSLRGLRG